MKNGRLGVNETASSSIAALYLDSGTQSTTD